MDVAKKQKGHGDTSSDTAVSLKKGDFTTPPVNPIFQKENGGLKCNISKPPFCAARPIAIMYNKGPVDKVARRSFLW